MLTSLYFDPARDGFRNPVGAVPNRTGGGALLRRSFDAFLYGRGLCFGMAAAALLRFADDDVGARPPLVESLPAPDLLDVLRRRHVGQFFPRVVFAAVRDWLASAGGRPESVFGRLRLAGKSSDPHVLCFGPAPNRRFFSCFARAHAVVPCRFTRGRVYVYDPNHPEVRERYVEFWRDGGGVGFAYGPFRSREGWGITLVPMSAVSQPASSGQL